MRFINYIGILSSLLLFINCRTSKQTTAGSVGSLHKKPLVIAHRGGSHLAPENTAPAFDNAMKLGADMIEIDIEQTRDGVVIVLHDATVDRTTQGFGAVDKLNYAYIKTLDAGSHFSKKYKGIKISTLEEVMDQINSRTGLLVEIKEGNERYPGIEEKLVSAIRKGMYKISQKYFQLGNKKWDIVTWKGPGIKRQEIPASYYFHEKE